MKSIGVDIIKNSKLNEELINKFLSMQEKKIMNNYKSFVTKREFAAGRWVGKEAIIKATNKKFLYSRIEILRGKKGEPIVFVDEKRRNDILISISHEKKYSIAMVCII